MQELTLFAPMFGDIPVAVPCVRMTFYLIAPASECAVRITNVLQKYTELVPPAAIKGRVLWDDDDDEQTYIEPFDLNTPGIIQQVYQPELLDGIEMHSVFLLGSMTRESTGYSVTTMLSDTEINENSTWLNFLEVNTPLDFVKGNLNAVVDFFSEVLDIIECRCANCGCSLDFQLGVEPFIRKQVNALIMRFVGLDGCYKYNHMFLGHRLPHVSWLTYIDPVIKHQWMSSTKIIAPEGIAIQEKGNGLIFRASALPPIGDMNQGGLDIGTLPNVSKMLGSILMNDPSQLKWLDEDFRERWLERLDRINPQPWDNVDYVPY